MLTRPRLAIVVVSAPLFLLALMIASVLDADAEDTSCRPDTVRVGPYGPEQLANASAIIATGHRRAIPEQGIVIALMAAMTESGLRNLPYGDRDSLGLFQMRPSMGWGSPAQVLDPEYASNKFYDVLLSVPGWHTMPPGAAAQAVERSAYPQRYALHEGEARHVLAALSGCGQGGTDIDKVIAAALSQLGVPYAWGGGDADGPTPGTGLDQGIIGFDCSGLALYAYAQIGIDLPHQTQAIWHTSQPAITNPDRLQPGDLILLSHNGRPDGIHHLGIYLGDDRVIHAPESGDVVRITENIWQSPFWSGEFIGAVRPATSSRRG
ncbi:C40 family peptidase [Actinokineospora sp. NPDC004072]